MAALNMKIIKICRFRCLSQLTRRAAAAGSLAVLLLLGSCFRESRLAQYTSLLGESNYAEAAKLYSEYFDTEEEKAEAGTVLAEHLMQLQQASREGTLSLDQFASQLDELAAYRLAPDGSAVSQTASVILSDQEKSGKITQARTEAARGNLEAAVILLEEARPLSVQSESSRAFFAESRKNYRLDILQRSQTMESQGNYSGSVELLKTAAALLPGDTELEQRLAGAEAAYIKMEREALLEHAGSLRRQEAWQSALDALTNAPEAIREDHTVKGPEAQIKLDYEMWMLRSLEELESEELHQEALEDVSDYLKVFPDSLKLQWKQRVYAALLEQKG